MNIIGTSSAGFLISASKDEIAELMGFYWSGSNGCPHIAVGSEIPVAKMFTHIEFLKSSGGKLNALAAELRVIADAVEVRNRHLEWTAKIANGEANGERAGD